MYTKSSKYFFVNTMRQHGVSIIELIVFLVVVGVASTFLFRSYNLNTIHSVDPLIQVRALESAQSKLDEILALKYDAQTPTGGIPACNSTDAGAVVCYNTPDGDINDVDDFNGYHDVPYVGYTRDVVVTTVTLDIANDAKLIRVTVAGPLNTSISLATYRANF